MKYILIINCLLVFIGCSPKSKFSTNQFLGTVEEIYSLDQEISKPTVQIGFIIDNSSSMAEEQQQLAKNVENMINALHGYNVDIYMISTTPFGKMHRMVVEGNPVRFQPVSNGQGKWTYAPFANFANSIFSKPFMDIPDFRITNSNGGEENYIPINFDEIRSDNLPWKINFNAKTNLTAVNNNQIIKLRTNQTKAQVQEIASKIKNELNDFGTSGSPDEYGVCALYRLSRDMLQSGMITSIFLISDADDRSDWGVDVTHGSSYTFESASRKGLSYCFDQGTHDAVADHRFDAQYKYTDQEAQERYSQNPEWVKVVYHTKSRNVWVEYAGLEIRDSGHFPVQNTIGIFHCKAYGLDICPDNLQEHHQLIANPRPLTALEIQALEKHASLVPGSVTKANFVGHTVYSNYHSHPYHTEDYTKVPYTHNNVTYPTILGYYQQLTATLKTYAMERRWELFDPGTGFLKRYPRTNSYPGNIGSLLKPIGNDFSLALGDEFIKVAKEKFPLFTLSSIIYDPNGNHIRQCQTPNNNVEGSIYKKITEKVNNGDNSHGYTHSICDDSYQVFLDNIVQNFIAKNAALSYRLDFDSKRLRFVSAVLVKEGATDISLKITFKGNELDQYDAFFSNGLLVFNETRLKSILNLDVVDEKTLAKFKIKATFAGK